MSSEGAVEKSDAALFVESVIAPEGEVREDLAQRLGDRRAYRLLGAALTIAVRRRFPADTSTEDIRGFVSDMAPWFSEVAENFDAKTTEHVIRGVRSERHLLDEIDTDYLADMSFLVTYAIMSPEDLRDIELDAYLTEVISFADAD